MKKELFENTKKELFYILILFFIALIIFKIAFSKENLIVLLRNVFSLFWLFVLPGYFIMLYWKEKLEFLERLIVGVVLAAAVIGISSYYLGLIGINIKYHIVLLPSILIISGILLMLKK